MGHQPNLSGGPYQSSTPTLHHFGQDQLLNGTREDGLDDEFGHNEYWQEQRRLYEDSKDNSDSHNRAKTYAQQSKSLTFGGPLGAGADDVTMEDKVRSLTSQTQSRSPWTELDMGGQGLRALSLNLYNYSFLSRLYVPHNQLQAFPAALGQLKNLEYLDMSFNSLMSLPEEIGMLTNLKTLLLTGNRQLLDLPSSIGYLYKLETMGLYETGYWENMPDGQRHALLQNGTKGLVRELLESMPEECKSASRQFLTVS